jgi:hypothetical protein
MEDRHNLDQIRPDAIHDSAAAVDHLTKRVVADLRNDAAGQRVGLEAFDRGNEALNEKVGGVRRVAGHIGSYCLDVFDGQR